MGLQSLSKCWQRAGGNGYFAHVILEFGNGQTQANGIESGQRNFNSVALCQMCAAGRCGLSISGIFQKYTIPGLKLVTLDATFRC